MKDFQKIDWKLYNKPPFYQQWLCRGDTHKLSTFGDRGLGELDNQILALKDVWDLDNVKGHFLDRIGKLLSEPRNGNTDEYYRIILKLRRLLNTNDGSIPSIIKAIKFIYSSEVVHIVPDYPAGLIIEHDGEGTPGLNFNKLLAEIIGAGISYSTKEIFRFVDTFNITDNLIIIVRRKTSDSFQNGLKYNKRGKYDGHTLNPTEIFKPKYSGRFQYDRSIEYRGQQEVPADDTYIRVPFKYSRGIRDVLNMVVPQTWTETTSARTKYNRAVKYSGAVKYNAAIGAGLYEVLQTLTKKELTDSEPVTESLAANLIRPLDEHFTTHNRYDGYTRYSGEEKYRAAREAFAIDGEGANATDTVPMAEAFSVGKRNLRKFNGVYQYDGEIIYNGNVLIPM